MLFLNLLYDNDLMWQLEESYMDIYGHNTNCGSPGVADDKLVLSLSKQGMDLMIAIWYIEISSLPGKASKMFVDIVRLAE